MKIAIVGFGASGLFCALNLKDSKHKVDIFDVGPEFTLRHPCPRDVGKIQKCPANGCAYCSVYNSGGIFNDGKTILNASPYIGGDLYHLLGSDLLQKHTDFVKNLFLKTANNLNYSLDIIKPTKDNVSWIQKKAVLAGMVYAYQELFHIGSDRLPSIISQIYAPLKDNNNFSFHWKEAVQDIGINLDPLIRSNYFLDVPNNNNSGLTRYYYDAIVISAGRSGSKWLMATDFYKKLAVEEGRVDLGIRLETSNEIMSEINDKFYEAKLYYKSPTFRDTVRSFCSNPSGFVCVENNKEFSIVNGHAKHNTKSQNTNLAILVSKTFTEPFKSPVKYGNVVASLANMLGGGPLVQRLGDLKRGRRTKSLEYNSIIPTLKVECGDLSLALPHRIMVSILEYIEAMDKIAPGFANDDTLLYGVEAKYFTEKIKVSNEMEALPNCFIIGDISGHTRGISQSCVSGYLAGESLSKRI